jgi:hypothetical protein
MVIQRIKNKLGSVLAFVLIILLVMTLVVFAIASLSSKNLNNVVGEYWEDRARFGAVTGVHRVLTELAINPAYAGIMDDMPLEGDPDVTWSVKVENNVANALGKYATDNRTWIPGGGVYIRSVGRMRTLATSSITSVAAIIAPQRPVFNDALFGVEGVILDRSQTLSWDPRANGVQDAHVATNAILNDVIQILNGSHVDGDAISGVGSDIATAIRVDSSTLVGQPREADETKVTSGFMSPIDTPGIIPPTLVEGRPAGDPTPQVLTPGNVYGSLDLDGTEVTLDGGGYYYFKNYIDMREGPGGEPAVLNIRGATLENPVRIYFTTSAVFWQGARVNWGNGPDDLPGTADDDDLPNEPRKVQIYAVDGTTANPVASVPATMHIKEVNKVAFVTAGGDYEVFLTDAVFHGSIIAKIIRATDSVINYDVRLKGVPLDGTGGFEILSMVVEPKNQAIAAVPPANPPAVAVNPPQPAPGAPVPPAGPPGVDPPAPPPPTVY